MFAKFINRKSASSGPARPPEPGAGELLANEQRLRLALTAAGLGVFEHILRERRIIVTPEFCQILGLPPQTSLSEAAWVERVHPEDRRQVLADMQRIKAEGIAFNFEHRICQPDGQVRWIHAMAAPVLVDGTLGRIHGVVQDITERKRAESELRQFTLAVGQSPASVVITDLQGRIEYVNPKFCAVTGYSLEEVRGKNPRVLKSGEMPAETYRQMWADITAGKEWRGEFHNRKKNGELYWESASIAPVRDARGEITHFIAIKEDITERKRVESLVRQSEERYRNLVNTARDAIFTIAADGTFTSLNPATETIGGLSRADWIGRPFAPMVHPDDLRLAEEMFQRVLSGKPAPLHELRGHPTLPRPAILEMTLAAQKDETGKIIGVLGIGRDVTERNRAAQELAEHKENEERVRRALEHEHALNRIKSHFVSLVSHEFRTPLSVISMGAFMLRDYGEGMSGEERAEHVQEIQLAVGRMTGMMEDFLVHEKIQCGKMACHPARMNLEAFCQSLIPEAGNHFQPARQIELSFDPAVREVSLDEKILRHILCNLLSNAVKYSDAGQLVKLEVRRVPGQAWNPNAPKTPTEDQLQFTVSDSGIGIPAADLAKIYETFHRAANVGNRPGTGMGLAIVKQFVELHRGVIRVESQEGKGTTVRLWLPLGSTPSIVAAGVPPAVEGGILPPVPTPCD